jgi:hypothetical protein
LEETGCYKIVYNEEFRNLFRMIESRRIRRAGGMNEEKFIRSFGRKPMREGTTSKS